MSTDPSDALSVEFAQAIVDKVQDAARDSGFGDAGLMSTRDEVAAAIRAPQIVKVKLPNPCEPDPCNGHGVCTVVDSSGEPFSAGAFFNCACTELITGETCSECLLGLIDYPTCRDDPCDPDPCNVHLGNSCSQALENPGECTCLETADVGYEGDRCELCADGYIEFPVCRDNPCEPHPCNGFGECNIVDGSCACNENITGATCDECVVGRIDYPTCRDDPCDPDPCNGDHSISCNQENGACTCTENWHGPNCEARNYPVTTSVDVHSVTADFDCDGNAGETVCEPSAPSYTTYRLYITLPDDLTTSTFESIAAHAPHDGRAFDGDPLLLPPAYNEPSFGSNNFGGVLSTNVLLLTRNLLYDSWLTIEDDSAELQLNWQMDSDITFDSWNVDTPLTIAEDRRLWVDRVTAEAKAELREAGDRLLVAQMTTQQDQAYTATLNFEGTLGSNHDAAGEVWRSVGVTFNLEYQYQPEPEPEPEPEPLPVPVPMPVPVPVLPTQLDAQPIVEEYAFQGASSGTVDRLHSPVHPGLEGYTTYRLYLQLPADAANIYTIFGDQNSTMTFPSGVYQEPSPFGSDVGGTEPAFWEIIPSLQYDSWLTIGMENLTDPS
eukprot:SAG31_NODE_2792_length_5084_cov_2.581745_1_plen_607_part_10